MFKLNSIILVAFVLYTSCGCIPMDVYEAAANIQLEGYVAETHHVTTEDGYILEMHRIPYRRGESEPSTKRPVLIQHGLLTASYSFIQLGPNYSIAYNLADAGYDVWLGNNRGNKASRFHETIDPDEDKFAFFDYSYEEIGAYDVAAMTNYILEHTGRNDLHYIGHSQGGTAFMVLNSMRPEFNAKFKSVHLLAGVGYMEHFPLPLVPQLTTLIDIIHILSLRMGIVELFPPGISIPRNQNYSMADYCTGNIQHRAFCEMLGISIISKEREIYRPAGAALKQIIHYGQNVRDKQFRRFDFGTMGNIKNYGRNSPPSYNLTLITAKITMHYTVSDLLLDQRDVLAMVNDIPNAVARRVARDSFRHSDFIEARDVKELVTDYIIESMDAIENSEDENENIDESENNDVQDGEQSTDSATSLMFKTSIYVYLILYSVYLCAQ